jgi:SAM-dependent methyltransferase
VNGSKDPGDEKHRAPYVLGHSSQEIDRLATQALLVDPITRRFFREAGIGPGMRVLDVGSGAGDVTFLAAALVGASGEVVGVDRAPAALAAAKERAAARSVANVSFRAGDPASLVFEGSFDAVVGRYVLMFQRDPVAMLRTLARHLRPGGVIVFHEPDWKGARSFPPSRLYDQCCRWIADTFRASGADPHMGVKLYSTFVAAGLPAPSMQLESIVAGGVNCHDAVHFHTDLARTLIPDIERLGVASASEVDIDTLAERVFREVIANNGVIVGRSEIGAWSRL